MNTRALRIVIGFELRRMLLGPRGILTLLAVLLGMMTIVPTRRLLEEINTLKGDSVGVDPLSPAYGVIADWTELSRAEIAQLFSDYPPHLIAFFAVLLAAVPALAYITGFDQTANDIRARHLRFLLLRVDRATLLVGRALGVVLMLGIIYALVIVALMAVLSGLENGVGGATGLLYCVRIWFCALLFSLPMVALLSCTNVLTGSPRMALASAVGLQMTLAFVGWMWSDVAVIQHAELLFPTAFKYNLLSDDPEYLQVVIGHQLGLTILFAALAWAAFRRRDV
ncbi:MAG: hypothetical protein ACPGU1_04295 [Myxococcota bacterium]